MATPSQFSMYWEVAAAAVAEQEVVEEEEGKINIKIRYRNNYIPE